MCWLIFFLFHTVCCYDLWMMTGGKTPVKNSIYLNISAFDSFLSFNIIFEKQSQYPDVYWNQCNIQDWSVLHM